MSDVVLPRRAHAQPRPGIVPGGDCGACVLGGLLGLSVADAYDRLAGERAAFIWPTMRQALYNARASGLVDRLVADVPLWPHALPQAQLHWGLAAYSQALEWFDYVRMALDGGYYGAALVRHDGTGPRNPPDHFVLVCGARELRPGTGGTIRRQLLVSCSASAPDGRWEDVGEFLERRGGFSLFLARPAARP